MLPRTCTLGAIVWLVGACAVAQQTEPDAQGEGAAHDSGGSDSSGVGGSAGASSVPMGSAGSKLGGGGTPGTAEGANGGIGSAGPDAQGGSSQGGSGAAGMPGVPQGGTVGSAGSASAGSGGTPSGVNLVVNPGFETGSINGWDDWGGLSSAGTDPHTGVHAGKVNHPMGNGGGQIINVTPGATYTLSAWGKLTGGATWGATGYQLLDGVNASVGDRVYLETFVATYAQRTATIVVPASASRIQVLLWYSPVAGGGSSLFVDDFSLTKN